MATPNPHLSTMQDIEADPEERNNLLAVYPDVVALMKKRLAYWRTQMIPTQNKAADPNVRRATLCPLAGKGPHLGTRSRVIMTN